MAKKTTEKKRKRTSKSKINILYITIVTIIILLVCGGIIFKRYALDSVTNISFFIYIDENSTLDTVIEDLQKHVGKNEAKKIKRLSEIDGYAPWNNKVRTELT